MIDMLLLCSKQIHTGRELVVGHLPREISRFSWFIINRGAVISVKVVDVNRRKSPLVQGGLETPVKVIVAMLFSTANKQALDEYNILVKDHYEEPVDGNFEDATTHILSDLKGDSDTDESETDEEEA